VSSLPVFVSAMEEIASCAVSYYSSNIARLHHLRLNYPRVLIASSCVMCYRFIEDRQTANIVANIRALKLTSFFDVTGLLSLICSHPSIFVRRIEKRERDREGILRRGAASGAVNSERTPELDEDEDVTEDGTTSAAPNALLDTDTIEQKYSWARPLLDNHEGDKIEHSFKMLAFRDILKCSNEVGDSTLVFSHSIPTLDILENHVKAMGLKYLRLDGKTPMGDRQKSAKKFNTGDCAVFLVSTEAGGLGLNLYGANRVIIFDFKWSPTWESQAVGRAYRLGQKKHVFVYRFRSGGTYEDKMWNTAQFKSQLQSRVVDTKAPIREAHKKIQQYLAPPKEIPREDISAFEGKDMVLDRVIAHSREAGGYICSIEHTETFQPDADDALNEDEQKEVDELLKQAQASRELAEKEAKALQKVRRSSFSSSAPAPVTSTTVSSLSNNNGVPLSTAPTPGRISEAPSTVATSSPSAAPSPVTNPKIKDAEMRPPPYPLPPKAVPSSQPTARPSAKPSSSAPAPAPWSSQQARETKQLLDRLNQAAQQRPSLPIASSRLTQSEIGRLPENNDNRRLSDNLLTVQRSSGSESGRRSSSDIPQGSSTLEEIIRSTLPRVFKGRKSNGGSSGA